jgi:hypothetical protein
VCEGRRDCWKSFCLKLSRADLQQLGADDIGYTENVAEDINQSLLMSEAQEQRGRAGDLGFLDLAIGGN